MVNNLVKVVFHILVNSVLGEFKLVNGFKVVDRVSIMVIINIMAINLIMIISDIIIVITISAYKVVVSLFHCIHLMTQI